jgi:hypothetical protein
MSGGVPVPDPQGPGPAEGELHLGCRVWWFRLGEWVEVTLMNWNRASKLSVDICEVGCDDIVHKGVKFRNLCVDKPVDCGAMRPPTGIIGIMYWLERDYTVFKNL